MNICRIRAAGAGLAMAIGLAGCASPDGAPAYFGRGHSNANIYVAPGPSDVERVAIMPFKAPTELIGASVSDMLVTELLRAGRYHLVERSQMSQVLNEAEIAMSGVTEARAIELGNMMGADGVILGTVDEYASVARRGRTLPVVGLSLRLIDCRSGKVLWSADAAERAASDGDTLSVHARKVVHGIVSGLYQKWSVQPVRRKPVARESADDPGRAAPAAGPPAPIVPPPAAPGGFAVSDLGLRQVDIRWTPPVSAARLNVRVERGAAPEGPFRLLATVPAAQGKYSDRDALKDSATYYYRLSSLAPDGQASAPTPALESLTAPPPAPVAGFAAESGGVGIIRLRWNASPEPGVVEYVVCRADAEEGPYEVAARIRGREKTEHVDGGREPGPLKTGTEYFYRIQAVNAVGARSESGPAARAATRNPPPAVAGLSAESGRPREIALQWNASPDEKVASYEIHRARAEGEFARLTTVRGRDAVSYLDRGGEERAGRLGRLEDGAEYRYRIAAVNIGHVAGAPSPAVAASTKNPPTPPTGVSARSAEPRRTTLTWTANPESDIREYRTEYRPADNGRFAPGASAPGEADEGMISAVHTGLEDGTAYEFRVMAVDADTLQSAWSAPVKAVTKPAPPAPRGLRVDGRDGGAVLAWTPSEAPDIAAYQVWENGLLRSARLGESKTPEFAIPSARAGRRMSVYVVAVDADGLESARSEALDLRPPAASPAPAPAEPPPAETGDGS